MLFNIFVNAIFFIFYFYTFSPFTTFFLSSLIVLFLYYNNHIMLEYYYPNIPYQKKTYIVTNIVKSYILFILFLFSIPILNNIYYYNYWDISLIKNLGSMYASLDFSSFFYNQKMSKNTIYHHLSVILFFIVNLMDTYSPNSISRLIMLYAIFSSIAFHVNLLLGLRFLVNISPITYKICTFSYLISSLINWVIQLYFIMNQKYNNIILCIYLIILKYIITDDIILLQWLKHKSITLENS